MVVGILDLEYYYLKISPNPYCMKISSFHHQKGDEVKLITNKYESKMNYDIIYITKVDKDTRMAPIDVLNNPRSRIFGYGMEGFINGKMPPSMLACRPDYLLYPDDKTNRIQRSQFIQFADEKGKPLGLIQDVTNAFTKKDTIVLDKGFGSFQKNFLLQCLEALKGYQNVTFFEPISLKILLDDEEIRKKFLEIYFIPGTKFQFINDVGNNYEDAEKISRILLEIRRTDSRVNLGKVQFESITTDHFISNNAELDMERCFKIANLGKENNLGFCFKEISKFTPYTPLFKLIIDGMNYKPKKSFLEYIASGMARRRHCSVADIYANVNSGDDEQFVGMMHTLQHRKEGIDKYCLREGKNHFYKANTFNGDKEIR